ncbi:MAG: hypothetical protein ACMUEM_04165 [Flavobacteriales bacterium AspAUS03]
MIQSWDRTLDPRRTHRWVDLFRDDAVQQATLTNAYQSLSKVPLWIGIDAK